VLASHSSALISSGLAKAGADTGGAGVDAGAIPDVHTLPPAIAGVVSSSYGQAIGQIFLVAVPLLVVAAVAIWCIREVPLRTSSASAQE
jgi:hypothetical protein